jgi:hypothetical protein
MLVAPKLHTVIVCRPHHSSTHCAYRSLLLVFRRNRTAVKEYRDRARGSVPRGAPSPHSQGSAFPV